jgi:diaminohydroxyphosphoribosylaminopyrimidine deaminase/5-amino-6-(5-phosphoribosylamino)uracil reductase
MQRGRPWVRSKIAATLDGRTALANGVSKWITGEAARRDVHRWRALSSAVLTGSGTVVADDPGLDARPDPRDLPPQAKVKQPLRVIVDAKLRTPVAAKTLGLPGDVLILTTDPAAPAGWALASAGAQVEQVRADGPDHCDLAAVVERLAELEVNDVWVEAGPGLNGALLAAGLIDELVIYLAPRIFGDSARGMFTLPPIEQIADGAELAIDDVQRIGDDLRITARPIRVAPL